MVSGIFEIFFEGILPFFVAVVFILVILFVCFLVCMMVAGALGYDVGMDEKKKTEQEKGECRNKEDSLSSSGSEKEDPGAGGGDGSGTGGNGEVDEKTRLRVEIEMLEGILRARKERLGELNKG